MKKHLRAVFLFILSILLSSCGTYAGPVETDKRIVSPFVETEDTAVTTNERIVSPLVVTEDTTVADTEAVIEILPPVEQTRLHFLAAGDNVIHPCLYMDAERRATASGVERQFDFKPMYADVIDYIQSFDIAFINQETLMGGESLGYSGYPRFNSPQDLGYDLAEMGFDVVNIANNHMCDKGKTGLAGTIDFLKSIDDYLMIGGYSNAEDYDTPRILTVNGIRIAFLSYTYGTNGLSLPYSSELVVPYINDDDIIRQTATAKEQSDLLFVSVHWGNENQTTVSEEQKRVAELLSASGVDVIIGHHPHVLQTIEWITSGEQQTLCIYSLGNLVSAMADWQNMVGGFFTFDIVQMSDGDCHVENPAFVTTAFYYGPTYFNTHLYFLDEYPKEKADTHGTGNLYGSYASPTDMQRFAEKIMGEYLSYSHDSMTFTKQRNP